MKTLKYKDDIINILDKYNIDISIDEIEKRYNEKHRHYHTLNHINFLNDKIYELHDKMDIDKEEKEILIVSSIFHDIIYEIGNKNNELNSSNYFLSCTDSKLTPFILRVYNIIIDTKKHNPKNKLSEIFCDLDMYTLSDLNYLGLLKMEKMIYNEFNIYGNKIYKENRILFLESTLKTKYGQKNKDNIDKLINFVDNFDINLNYLDYIDNEIKNN